MSTIAFDAQIIDIRSAASARTARSTATSARPHLRMTARGRAVLLTILAAPLSIMLLVIALNGGVATATLEAGAPAQVVMVQPGQSLWSIAEEIAPNADPRDVILEIMSFNQLESANVLAGQQLSIPQQYSSTH